MAKSVTLPYLERALYDERRRLDFYKKYTQVHDAFVGNVLPEVTALGSANSGLYLTDHGPDHIRAVIEKASELAASSSAKLSAYECFLLLIAIVIHDVGNALGRADHESKIDEVWQKVFGPLGFDELDKVIAIQIAQVHGGSVNGSKDTIRSIERTAEWKKERVRPQLLAAFLRLADEMAEDRSRASALGLELGNLPVGSQIYHVFANALHTFSSDGPGCELRMTFAADCKYFTQQFGKGAGFAYLIDEIFERTVKSYNEARYCTRYLAGTLVFDKVRVKIEVFGPKAKRLFELSYLLEEREHPSSAAVDIYKLAPELSDFGGKGLSLNATSLEAAIKKTLEPAS